MKPYFETELGFLRLLEISNCYECYFIGTINCRDHFCRKASKRILKGSIGSGTTAIACERLNRKWIGIEISEEYCEIAKQRIINETRQRKLPGF